MLLTFLFKNLTITNCNDLHLLSFVQTPFSTPFHSHLVQHGHLKSTYTKQPCARSECTSAFIHLSVVSLITNYHQETLKPGFPVLLHGHPHHTVLFCTRYKSVPVHTTN